MSPAPLVGVSLCSVRIDVVELRLKIDRTNGRDELLAVIRLFEKGGGPQPVDAEFLSWERRGVAAQRPALAAVIPQGAVGRRVAPAILGVKHGDGVMCHCALEITFIIAGSLQGATGRPGRRCDEPLR